MPEIRDPRRHCIVNPNKIRITIPGVIEVDGILYEVDIKAYLDLANDENPLQEIIGPLGLQSLMPELDKRFKEVLEEKRESLENYSFPDSLLQP